VVGADLQGLVATHQQADLLGLLVLHEADITGTTLLPLVGLLDETEELGAPVDQMGGSVGDCQSYILRQVRSTEARNTKRLDLHLEEGNLILLVGLDLDSLELDNGLKVDLSLLILLESRVMKKQEILSACASTVNKKREKKGAIVRAQRDSLMLDAASVPQSAEKWHRFNIWRAELSACCLARSFSGWRSQRCPFLLEPKVVLEMHPIQFPRVCQRKGK